MYNTFAYIIYLSLVLVVVVFAGGFLFRNGKFFLEEIFHDSRMVDAVNRILYAGYCLINIGGAFNCLHKTKNFNSYLEAMDYVTDNEGMLLILLALMHYFNMLILPLLKNIFHPKQQQIYPPESK